MRLLFITPSFFGYESAISQAFERAGVTVDRYDERPRNSSIARAVLRVAPWAMAGELRSHFRAILHETRDVHVDVLLIIKGENVPVWFVEEFTRLHPTTRRIFYTFDSMSNSSRGASLLPMMDRAFSFDRRDVARFGALEYKPLFYAPEFDAVDDEGDIQFLVSFVGTLHSDRYAHYRAVVRNLPPSASDGYFYSPARWFYAAQRLSTPELRGAANHVKFDKLDRREVARRFARARAVLDVQRPGQSGLTMRTFEALATGAALITTNEAVVEEPFFDPQRIFVVPRQPELVDAEAVATWVHGLPPRLSALDLADYSIDRWVTGFLPHETDR